ncbi:hypothetical protein A7C99_1581 [Trichophyton rubrum]|uniref:Bicarbonate transporter-like transmembrane domain-containing protein n=1 Tax=Trichophyton rubrum TaxID=5551 RepID=A0A178F5C4_TRIRU|nr:hypothetical protein A7C99_1581 [Trichophyton rubrum]
MQGMLRRRKEPRPSSTNQGRVNYNEDVPDEDDHSYITPSKHTPKPLWLLNKTVGPGGPLRPFRLVKQDLVNLRQRYLSDWKIFNHLIVASTVYVFFTNLLPGITFASDLYVLTGKNWGAIEIPFLPFMAWSLIHAGWLHYLLAIFNAHDWTMGYVTTFSTEIFSLLNSIIYFHKAIQELERAHANLSFAAFLYAIIGAVGTMLLAIFLSTAESWKPLFHRYIRLGLSEYAAAISIILFIGLPHIGELAHLDKSTLPVSVTFQPTSPERHIFFVEFWKLPARWIFVAIIPGIIITMLFFFDHEISSIICTIDRYKTRKPGGFAWDIILLGTTTALCGILGIPPANGLLPQAPLHSESLMHADTEEAVVEVDGQETVEVLHIRRVYEQRWSSLLHGCGILAFSHIVSNILPLDTPVRTTNSPCRAGLFTVAYQYQLLVMKHWFRREVLRFVDAWACKAGTPEDTEDKEGNVQEEKEEQQSDGRTGVLQPRRDSSDRV